jgi:acylphosphatase
MKTRASIKITGIVQGVGFRSWVARKAKSLNLHGYVKNEPDGSVYIVVEGEKDMIERLIELCWKGPTLAKVSNVEVQWNSYKGEFNDFEIRYSDYELP